MNRKIFLTALFVFMLMAWGSIAPDVNAASPVDAQPSGNSSGAVQAAPTLAIVRVTHTTADMQPSVQCPAGYKVVGGGFKGSEVALVFSSFKKQNGWQVKAKPYASVWPNMTVYATCLQWSHSVSYIKHSLVINSLQTASTAATCSAGDTPLGGGYKVNDSRALIYANIPAVHSWSARARNQAGDSRTLTVLVVCAPEAFTNQNIVSHAATVPAGTTKSSNQVCPSTLFSVMSGGFEASQAYWRVSSFPKNDDTWRVTVRNDHTPSAISYTIYANCFTFP